MALEYFGTIFAFAVVMLLFALVITIMVQSVVAAGGLRGRNLLWAVTKVLERSPDLKAHAGEIAEKTLRHPAVTPTGKRARVIGSEELHAVLEDLAASPGTPLTANAKEALGKVLKGVLPQESLDHAEKLASEFKKLYPNEAAKMDEALSLTQSKAPRLPSNLETWFDTIMSRSTDRFVMRTRVWTVVFAVLLAFGFQIDSFELLRNLSTAAELRAVLAQKAEQTLSRVDEVLLAKSVAVESLETIRPRFEELKDREIPASLVSRGQGEAWLIEEFKDSPGFPDIQRAYGMAFDELAPKKLEKLGNQILDLKTDLEESKMVVLPANWPGYVDRWKSVGRHLPGFVLSVLLLSLGAPFWFNALRSLASLRPILAGKIDPSDAVK